VEAVVEAVERTCGHVEPMTHPPPASRARHRTS
jgi:hypothetical protein